MAGKDHTHKRNFFPLSGRPRKLLFLSTSRSSQPVYVEFVNSGGCYSKIGRAYWPFPLPQAIYLGRCADYVGHIKHEMMHTLGFYHEHSRQVCQEDDALRLSVLYSNFPDLTVTCSSRSTGTTSGTGGRTSSTHSGENLFDVISNQGHYYIHYLQKTVGHLHTARSTTTPPSCTTPPRPSLSTLTTPSC